MTQIDIKERILQEAHEQFFKLGVSRVRMEDLAYSLGMSKKTLYQYFASKDDLLQAVVNKLFSEVKCCFDQIDDDPNLNILAKIKKVVQYAATQNARLNNGMMEDLRRSAPQIWKQIEAWRKEQIYNHFKGMMKAGIEEGIFRNDIPLDLIVTIYYNAIHYTIHPDHAENASYTPQEAYAAVFRIMMEGLFTNKAREEFFREDIFEKQSA